MAEVEKHAAANISRVLVGNKSDLEEKRDVYFMLLLNKGKNLRNITVFVSLRPQLKLATMLNKLSLS